MRAWIITAAPIHKANFYRTIKIPDGDIIVAADGGFDNCLAFNIKPQIIVGDFDSIMSTYPPDVKTVKFPSKKDKTDTHLAVDYCLDNGATEIVILGELSGRIDHTLSVISLLRYIKTRGAEGMVLSRTAQISLITDESTTIYRDSGKYFSLMPLTNCTGVDIKEAKYEMTGGELDPLSSKGISNEFIGLEAHVSIANGSALIIVPM
ncbi:MAG: thiamine diphosphokinase [Clostridiales bacterium]|nr:thiamine diphosphokinase [Clostridiales bacterium]